ncbi:cupin domain-containing protein, partial [Verminephrobacter aporrectodeae subsp. tuberculatae]|nr:cupin domain-containing protein [Verminephrobacter aporrectodeae subsp. tuberculatae]MCW8171295.1 cupin domain-containing protein [Verminephrobacter aporrectodeae subsp. tuberculatae]
MSGDEYQILLDAKSSGNTMTLLDALVPPAGGPPLHAHADVDELFLVLDGELDIMVDNAVYQVKAGGRVFVKRNVPHAFINRTDRPVRMLIFYTALRRFVWNTTTSCDPNGRKRAGRQMLEFGHAQVGDGDEVVA